LALLALLKFLLLVVAVPVVIVKAAVVALVHITTWQVHF
jgi:hypothetical protein